ncbi:hypothetical protein EV645_4451 [Kribbella rubisoli]|uniref:Uncharacterized protein n=1 Tax=Kribbella rubisoli TaxID=3075929 RepID=A0A4Q7WT77_9ACTN|nr:hypothetical protein EV645_4451 [Kribbella rubisoli]
MARATTTADKEKEARASRSEVYADYLKAAATYRDRGYDAWRAVDARAKDPKIPYNAIRPTLANFEIARRAYRDQANRVAVYGSPKAWAAQKTITSSMLSTLAPVQVADKVGGPDFKLFNAGYKEFIMVFCEDAQAMNVPDCRPARGEDVGATR